MSFMQPMSNSLLWSSRLDNKYVCQMERMDDTVGRLTIRDQNATLMFEKFLDLNVKENNKVDMSDLANWQNICISYIDSQTSG